MWAYGSVALSPSSASPVLSLSRLLHLLLLSCTAEGKGAQRVLSISLCKSPPLGTDEGYAIWPSLLLGDDAAAQDQLRV